MPQKPANGTYTVIGAARKPYDVQIDIEDKAWAACENDLQNGVINILENEPIQLLPTAGKGSGIKQESKGLEFHTQTNKRLQAPLGRLTDKRFTFTTCGKGWGH
jgi:hypothetical protein